MSRFPAPISSANLNSAPNAASGSNAARNAARATMNVPGGVLLLRRLLAVLALSLGSTAAQAQYTVNPPTNLTATAGNAQVSLSWTASTSTVAYYRVKRATVSGGPYTTIASPNALSYTDTSVTNGTTYYYVVTAVNPYGYESSNSNQASATPSATTAPAAPTNLTATAGNAQVSLSWTGSGGATSYNVKRATVSGGPYTTVASPTGTTYTNTGLTNGTTYY